MNLIDGSALKAVTVLCLVYCVLTAGVASMCGREQLLLHSNHVYVNGVKQNDAVKR